MREQLPKIRRASSIGRTSKARVARRPAPLGTVDICSRPAATTPCSRAAALPIPFVVGDVVKEVTWGGLIVADWSPDY
jgi:hypothetical protein